jgi:hypothetical protein
LEDSWQIIGHPITTINYEETEKTLTDILLHPKLRPLSEFGFQVT